MGLAFAWVQVLPNGDVVTDRPAGGDGEDDE